MITKGRPTPDKIRYPPSCTLEYVHQFSQTGLTEASRLAARECGAGTVVASAACVGYLYDVRLVLRGGG